MEEKRTENKRIIKEPGKLKESFVSPWPYFCFCALSPTIRRTLRLPRLRCSAGQTTHNFTGKVGSYTADSLIRLLGIASFLLPVILFWHAVLNIFYGPRFTINTNRFVGFFFFVLSFAGLMALLISGSVTIYGESLKDGTGGLIGVSIVEFLRISFNVAGTYIILFLIFVVALTFMVEFSIVSLTERISQFAVGAIHSLQKPYLVFCKLCSGQRENRKKTATGDNRR